jgi:hypothetical protein
MNGPLLAKFGNKKGHYAEGIAPRVVKDIPYAYPASILENGKTVPGQ